MSGYKQRKEKYVDLKTTGRLFPSWILANFKAYKLPEMAKIEDDPCFRKTKLELRKYQLFISKYLDFNSPHKNMLIYWGVGSGKTGGTINIYNMLYNYTPGWNVFILLKATLKNHPWMTDLNIWLNDEEKKYRMENIVFISYDAPNADKAFMDAIKNADTSKKNLFIIEEAHNFIRNVYSNMISRQGRRAITIYDYIIQDQKENDGTRVLALSGTPAINSPFELAILFNLLRPGIFPKNEVTFTQDFISTSNYKTLNPAKKNIFQRRILGLVSYYIGATPDYYASKTVNYVDVIMSPYQDEISTYFENLEEQLDRKKRSKSKQSSGTYNSYTRQACNFVFPLMAQGMSGETRPRPRLFKVSENSSHLLEKGKMNKNDVEKKSDKYYNIENYLNATEKFVSYFDNLLNAKQSDDEKSGNTLDKDLKLLNSKYDNDLEKYINKSTSKSTLITELHKCSAKFLTIILSVIISPGPVLLYSNYVLMEGIQIFKIYLKYFGFTSLDRSKSGVDGFRYTEYHGGIDSKDRSINLERFNDKENKHGKICKIMMISPAGAEGISLYNVRQVHLTEPYWHEVRMIQMIGRAIRMCSHKDLPLNERHVDIYRYKSIRKDNGKWTTDQRIEDMARGKEGLIQSFLDAVKEAAVDCVLNKSHNSLVQQFKCFQFEEQSLFDDQIGPAYKDDLHEDSRFNNGSNSMNSKTIRIKIIKINAVIQLSSEDDTKVKYSPDTSYWYNPNTGIVYDYELHYPIGKIGYDSDNLPKKLNKDTYIIDKLIPIPLIK